MNKPLLLSWLEEVEEDRARLCVGDCDDELQCAWYPTPVSPFEVVYGTPDMLLCDPDEGPGAC